MKRTLLLMLAAISLVSCKNTWGGEEKEMFHQSCMEEAVAWAATEADAKTYCDCVLDKTMQKFPKVADALEHIDSVIADPAIKDCKTAIPLKN